MKRILADYRVRFPPQSQSQLEIPTEKPKPTPKPMEIPTETPVLALNPVADQGDADQEAEPVLAEADCEREIAETKALIDGIHPLHGFLAGNQSVET